MDNGASDLLFRCHHLNCGVPGRNRFQRETTSKNILFQGIFPRHELTALGVGASVLARAPLPRSRPSLRMTAVSIRQSDKTVPDGGSMVILLMGVSGAGKTTIGRLLASQLKWDFADADDYHPA